MILISNIETIILNKGLKKSHVAKEVGISNQMMSRWLKQEAYPSADKLWKLAFILDCRVDDLYRYEK